MNIRKGAFRVWVLASVAWLIYMAGRYALYCGLGVGGLSCDYPPPAIFRHIDMSFFEVALMMAVPPLALFAVGRCAGWVISGFR